MQYVVQVKGKQVLGDIILEWPATQKAFKIQLPGGKQRRWSALQVEAALVQEGGIGLVVSAAVRDMGTFTFQSPEACRGALAQVMPGFHPPSLFVAVPEVIRLATLPGAFPDLTLTRAQLQQLAAAVDYLE